MPLPATWKTVTVTATFTRADTAGPASGSVQFTPVKAVGIAADVVLPALITATLNGSGQISVALPCPNSAGVTSLVYEVIERVPGGRSYYIEVLASMTGSIALADFDPLTDDQAAYYSLRGPTGDVTPSALAAQAAAEAAFVAADASADAAAASASAAAASASAAAASIAAGSIYATTSAGLAATTNGQYFSVPSADSSEYLILYKNNAGSALEVKRYPSADAVAKPAWVGKKNGWPDPFFRTFDLTSENFFGRDRWWQGAGALGAGWTRVANSVFDGYALRRADGYNQTTFSGPVIWLDEIAASPGDQVTAYVLISGYAGGSVYCAAQFTTDNENTLVGAVTSMLSATGANNVVASATPQYLRITLTVPATATKLRLYAYNMSGSTGFDVLSVWAFKGDNTKGPQWPTIGGADLRLKALEAASALSLSSNASRQIKQAYLPYVMQAHTLGDAEMVGDSTYSQKVLAGCEQFAEASVVNAVQWRAWASNSLTAVEWKAFIRDTPAAFNPGTETAAAAGTIAAGSFPVSDTLYTLRFTSPIYVPAGKYLFVAYRAADDSNINIKRWLYNAGVSPARHGFLLGTANGWNQSIVASSVISGFGQTAMKFLLESEELRNYTPPLLVPDLVMPAYVYGVQSRECNVYLDNLHFADSTEYLHDVLSSGSYGTHQNERFTWTPSGAVGSGTLTVTVHDKRTGGQLASKTAQLRAAAASAGSGANKKVLVIGDSLISAGTITQTLIDIAATDVMAVNMLGTQGTGTNKHEGRGGWTIGQYVTAGSPFYISGVVNFGQYLIDNSIATPDWVFIHLGINDCFGQTTDAACSTLADAAFLNLDTLLTSIKAADANVKIGLLIPSPPSADQDAFGANYGVGQTRWRFKRNILIWARQLCLKYNGQEANRIYVVPSNTALDTVNNMSRAASAPINSRTATTSQRQNNGVHPATEGYRQIGDALWAFLKFYA